MKPYRGRDVEGYLDSVEEDKQEIVREVRNVIRDAIPDAKEAIKWGALTFEKEKIICAIMVHKEWVNLQLWRGAELKDKDGLLQGTTKAMRHVSFASLSDIKRGPLRALLKQAAKLD